MKRLIQRGLMFGNLFHVSSPALVERYNRALKHLTGKTTALTDFHIDISGFAPEIGDELDDPLYLNHAGVNRQFILLSTEQKRAPLLNTKFSTSRAILRHFIDDNEAQLFALTARDAVAGELVNSVYDISTPPRLFDIRAVKIEADTTSGTVQSAHKLAAKVDTFLSKEDAWFDDVLIAEMVSLANETGDVRRNPVRLQTQTYQQSNFWTAHFGGLYMFQGMEHPALIAATTKDGLDDLPIKYVFDLKERNRIAKFLEFNNLAEPIVKARGTNAAAILSQKMEFILIDTIADQGIDLTGVTGREMRRLTRENAHLLPDSYHALAKLVQWAQHGGRWPKITSDHPAYFYTLRASDHDDADLVNMLLAELCPADIRQMFICHKELFYKTYTGWADVKKDYVATYLEAEYQSDKAGARAALFGHAPNMVDDVSAPPKELSRDMIDRVGPWGAVRRK